MSNLEHEGHGFKVLSTQFEPDAAEYAARQLTERRTHFEGGLELGANPLPLGDTVVTRVLGYPKIDARTCLLAAIVAGSQLAQTEEQARSMEWSLITQLSADKLIGPHGVLTNTDAGVARIQERVSTTLGIDLEEFLPAGVPTHLQHKGQEVSRHIQDNQPLIINTGNHWLLVDGVRRTTPTKTSWRAMDPNTGGHRFLTSPNLTNYILPESGATPHFIIKPK